MTDTAEGKILAEVKAPLGLLSDASPFDVELLIHINGVVAQLLQLGVGPVEGLIVDENTTWTDLLMSTVIGVPLDPDFDRRQLQNVKSYVYMKVKMLFDSGSMTAQLVSAYEKMIAEAEFRISVAADPQLPWEPVEIINPVLDGGGP